MPLTPLITTMGGGGTTKSLLNSTRESKEYPQFQWQEFKIGDLFNCQTGDVDLQQKDIDNKGEFFINSGLQNNGIKGKTSRSARIFSPNTITIDFWGNAFYRNFYYKMATHNHVFSLDSEIIKNKEIGLFLTSCMRYMTQLFSYSDMGTWTKIKENYIILPTNKDGSIAFDFIESFITAIQKEVIKSLVLWNERKLNAYKKAIVH